RHGRIGEASRPRPASPRRSEHSCPRPRGGMPDRSAAPPSRRRIDPRIFRGRAGARPPREASADRRSLGEGGGSPRGRSSVIVPLELTGLTKTFQTPTGPFVAVKNVNARIQRSEFVCILGHSG